MSVCALGSGRCTERLRAAHEPHTPPRASHSQGRTPRNQGLTRTHPQPALHALTLRDTVRVRVRAPRYGCAYIRTTCLYTRPRTQARRELLELFEQQKIEMQKLVAASEVAARPPSVADTSPPVVSTASKHPPPSGWARSRNSFT